MSELTNHPPIFHLKLSFEEALAQGTLYVTGITALLVAIHRLYVFIRGVIKTRPPKICKSCGLCKHKLFTILSKWITEVDNINWKCCNDYKTAIARDMIKIKFNYGIDYLKKSFCRIQHIEDRKEMFLEIKSSLSSLIESYEGRWVSEGIPEVIINKVSGFHHHQVNSLFLNIYKDARKKYMSNNEFLRSTLNNLIAPYITFVGNIRNVVDESNGILKDCVYKGIKNDNTYIPSIEKTELDFDYSFGDDEFSDL